MKPYDASLKFGQWTPMRLPPTPPRHDEKQGDAIVSTGGQYKLAYDGAMEGSYTLSVDFGSAASLIGVQTAVLYGVFDLEPKTGLTMDSNWSLTVDVGEIFRWSALLFTRAVGRVAGVPTSWYFKYVGELLPNPGKLTIGVKLFGQLGPGVDYAVFGTGMNATLTSMTAKGELLGKPIIRDEDLSEAHGSDPDQQWEFL